MRAAWYEEQGPAEQVLRIGELPDPQPSAGEVRVRLALSGANPGDVKKRQGWQGSSMTAPQVIPHSDGAGVIDAVGAGADSSRIGRRVWVYGAQSYRPYGTAAQATVVPQQRQSSCRTRFPTKSAQPWASPESPLTVRSSPTGRSPVR